MSRKLIVFGFITASFALSNAVSAQSYAVTVWTQLQAAYEVLTDGEDLILKNYVLGKLGESGTDSWSFPMVEGREYVVMAACDQDCSDVDLHVKYEGYLVAEDVETDDVPVLRFTAKTSGTHTIEVQMFECSNEPCYWGFGLYEK